jgi:hypothetical protein
MIKRMWKRLTNRQRAYEIGCADGKKFAYDDWIWQMESAFPWMKGLEGPKDAVSAIRKQVAKRPV